MKKKILPLLMLILGIGFGCGGMIVREMLYPPEIEIKYSLREPDAVGPTVDIGEITANLQGGGMVKTEIILEGVNKKSAEVIESRLIFVRDRIHQILITRSPADINTAEGQEDLKGELLAQVNEMLGDNVNKVLFSSFIFTR